VPGMVIEALRLVFVLACFTVGACALAVLQ
jgi:hypothetical protein